MFISYQAIEECNKEDVWLLDNVCDNHMTGNKEFFSSLDSNIESEIKLGDDHLVDALAKDIVTVLNKHNETKDISNVYYVQGLKHNLLSVGKMSQNGYKFTFEG